MIDILFICGSLEPGRDGVGDYTRRLAIEVNKKGYKTAAIAINDIHIEDKFLGLQKIDKFDLSILRIPSWWNEDKRIKQAKEWVEVLNPKWLSLQYVIFAFNKKGLPLRLNNNLESLGRGKLWHIMFHELWLGMNIHSSKTVILWGWIQKKIIKNLILKLNPKVIHTQIKIYQKHLSQQGFNCEYLPLFGNIPFFPEDIVPVTESTEHEIKMVMFGTLHPNAPVKEFTKELAKYSLANRVKISLHLIGRSGAEESCWISAWKSEGLIINTMGEQSPGVISNILNRSSIAISTSPFELAEKSGTIAAMLEFGLPVICVAHNWQERSKIHFDISSNIFKYISGNLESLLKSCQKNQYASGINHTSTLFASSLNI